MCSVVDFHVALVITVCFFGVETIYVTSENIATPQYLVNFVYETRVSLVFVKLYTILLSVLHNRVFVWFSVYFRLICNYVIGVYYLNLFITLRLTGELRNII